MVRLLDVCGTEIKIRGSAIRIATLHGDRHKFIDDPLPILDGLKRLRTRIDLFTFLQRLPDTAPKYSYPMEWDNLAVLRVTTFEHWWNHQIRSYPRNRARQAEKRGCVLREVPFSDALVDGIWKIYNESPVRQGRPFPHYGKDPATVYREEATHLEHSIFIGAFLGDELIGFAKLVFDHTRTQANLMNILSMIQHRDKAPTNAIIAHAVKACADRQIPYLVYQKFSYGKAEDSLRDFKQVNGFEQVDVPRYFVPLTQIGRLVLRFGLQHGIVHRLHGPTLDKIRTYRNAWYNRKMQVADTRQEPTNREVSREETAMHERSGS